MYSIHTVCNRGERGWVVWRAYIGIIPCVFDQTKLLYHPRGPQTDKHLPPCPFTGQFLKHLGFGMFMVIWSKDVGYVPLSRFFENATHSKMKTVIRMQLHSDAELFGKAIYRGIIARGCS
jgi:hypothetical protein